MSSTLNKLAIAALEKSEISKQSYKKSTSDQEKYTTFEEDTKINFFEIFKGNTPVNGMIRAINDNIISFKERISCSKKVQHIGASGTFFSIDKYVVAVVTSEPSANTIIHLAMHMKCTGAKKAVVFNPVEGYHRVINTSEVQKNIDKPSYHTFVYNKALVVVSYSFSEMKIISVHECVEPEILESALKDSDKIINIDEKWVEHLGKKHVLYTPMHDGINNITDLKNIISLYYRC